MPEMSKRTICALSAPVTVFTDEFMAELVQRLPREACSEIVQKALLRSQDRLMAQTVRNRRSDVYKAVLMARKMAERLQPVPSELAVLLGDKSADEAPIEGMAVEPAIPEPEDDFANLADDLPDFKQFASVFKQYPYVEYRETASFGKLLVLGYCSGRGKQSNKLYRRNCILVTPEGRRQGFKDIGSAIGVPQETGPDGTHYTIKAVPFADGLAVKCWTNIIGEGDVPDQYRYLVVNVENDLASMTSFNTEVSWETYQYSRNLARQA